MYIDTAKSLIFNGKNGSVQGVSQKNRLKPVTKAN